VFCTNFNDSTKFDAKGGRRESKCTLHIKKGDIKETLQKVWGHEYSFIWHVLTPKKIKK